MHANVRYALVARQRYDDDVSSRPVYLSYEAAHTPALQILHVIASSRVGCVCVLGWVDAVAC